MSRLVKLSTYRIAVVICALCGGLLGYQVGSGISQTEIEDAYEQGYIDGRAAFSDTLWNRWLNDSLGWGFSPHVKGTPHFYGTEFHSMSVWVWPWNPSVNLDSTDTMSDSTKPYMTMEIIRNSGLETVTQIIGDDTLYFHRQKVDTGYVLIPIYRMRKLWTPEDSADSVDWWKDGLDTSRGWYGWEISEALTRGWYDRAADTSHKVYEKALTDWAMSVLLRERTFVIYFNSNESSEDLLDCYGWEVPTIPTSSWIKGAYLPAVDSTDTIPVLDLEGVER